MSSGKKQTWSNCDVSTVFVVSDDAWHPSVQIVGAFSNTSYAEVAPFIGLCPKLIALRNETESSYDLFVANLINIFFLNYVCNFITLVSSCQDPTSPGGANPTYADFAAVIALSRTNSRPVIAPR